MNAISDMPEPLYSRIANGVAEALQSMDGVVLPKHDDSSDAESESSDELFRQQRSWNHDQDSSGVDSEDSDESDDLLCGECEAVTSVRSSADAGPNATQLTQSCALDRSSAPAGPVDPVQPKFNGIFFGIDVSNAVDDADAWDVKLLDVNGNVSTRRMSKAPAKKFAAALAASMGLEGDSAYLVWVRDRGGKVIPVSPSRRALANSQRHDPLMLVGKRVA